MHFTQPKRGRDSLVPIEPPPTKRVRIEAPTENEQLAFVESLKTLAPKAAVLSAYFRYETPHGPSATSSLPTTIMSLFRAHYRELGQNELLQECRRVFKEELVVTSDESEFLFKSTLLQSQSALWFERRCGQLTASKFGAVCQTSINSPSKSLVQAILQKHPVQKVAAMW